VLKYRAGGRQRWATIGTHGSPWTPETARREAKRLLSRIAEGKHPAFAAVAASGGSSLPMIGNLLGHTQAATTQRYAHLAADPIRAANDAIGERIAAATRDEGSGIGLSRGSR
jgi:integrase